MPGARRLPRRIQALTGAASLSLDLLSECEARELFVSIVGAERLAGQTAQIDAIAELCGRLPLAVRIAATRLAHRPAWRAADLLARLRTQHRLLSELAVEDQSLASAFAVSYDCLHPEQQQAFRLAGLHPGADFTSTDIAALSGSPLDVAEELLDELYYQHLIIERRAGRFVFHDLLLHHAREAAVVDESGEARAAALARLLDHYTYTAATAMDLLYPHEHHRRPQPKQPEQPLVAFAGLAKRGRGSTPRPPTWWPAASGPARSASTSRAGTCRRSCSATSTPAIGCRTPWTCTARRSRRPRRWATRPGRPPR